VKDLPAPWLPFSHFPRRGREHDRGRARRHRNWPPTPSPSATSCP